MGHCSTLLDPDLLINIEIPVQQAIFMNKIGTYCGELAQLNSLTSIENLSVCRQRYFLLLVSSELPTLPVVLKASTHNLTDIRFGTAPGGGIPLCKLTAPCTAIME